MFYEVDEVTKGGVRIQCTNKVMEVMRNLKHHPAANITVMGVGGAGRNAIRNMRQTELAEIVHLITVDTDMGCDIQRYGKQSSRTE